MTLTELDKIADLCRDAESRIVLFRQGGPDHLNEVAKDLDYMCELVNRVDCAFRALIIVNGGYILKSLVGSPATIPPIP